MLEVEVKKTIRSSTGPLDLRIGLKIAPGEVWALYGESGAGKTTLLRMLAGLLRPDEGRIVHEGEVWFDAKRGIDLSPQKRRAGLVFQDYALFPNMTVEGNLAFALPKRESKPGVAEMLDLMGLAGLARRLPAQLSGGQRQRVALARALIARPPLLLLDEPLSALDPEMRLRLQEELLAVHRHFGVTTLLVSHDLAEVFKLAGQVAWIRSGTVHRTGSPDEVFAGGGLSGKFKFVGRILRRDESAGELVVLTLQVGQDVVKVTSIREDAEKLAVGEGVLVVSKAFNPLIFPLERGGMPAEVEKLGGS